MITDDVQYRVTKGHLREFEEALANLEAAPATKPAKLRKLEIDAIQAKIDDFRTEITQYERHLSGEVSPPHEASTSPRRPSFAT